MTNDEVNYIMNAIKEVSENHKTWEEDYIYNAKTNEFMYKKTSSNLKNIERVEGWFMS